MTKVSILGDSKTKKIEFLGCLMADCKDVNFDSFSAGTLDPSTHDEITLVARNYGDKDVMFTKRKGVEFIMFGHFNDGVV